VVDQVVQSCPVDYRLKLYDNIILSGGNTLFPGFDKRLNRNLQTILDNRMAIVNEKTGGNAKI
jgi:actin-related protein